MALDSANDLLYIPAYGNGGFRAFQLNDQGLPVDRQARFITSRESLFGRRSVPPTNSRQAQFPGAGAIVDEATGRFFTVDMFANRILVYDGDPDRLAQFPAAELVIGQPDFNSTRRGLGPNRMGAISGRQLDGQNQRLFVSDGPNNRVLIFDVDPDRLANDPRAVAVIGQDDFESRDPGAGPSAFNRPGSIAYDPVLERLFVADNGNNRVLVFNADPDDPNAFDEATAVMGQPDFQSTAARTSLDQLAPDSLAYDSRHQRLFIAEDLEHRIMVYDAHPDRLGGPTTAMAVIGQPDAFSVHPAVSDSRVAMPRITIDSEREKLYISEGYPAGNRITVWDIAPDNTETGMSAVDVIGHETPDGEPDFFNRMAQGHLDGRSLAAARAVTLDSVDHRLFVPDEYNHRVVVWQLDELNRIVERDARWALGQPDVNTSLMGEPSAANMTTPIGSAYDSSTKRLFVGDGYHNRILVYEAAPGVLQSGMDASVVIGQPDFRSVARTAGAEGINFGVRMGRGIASDFLPMGFAVDEAGQRLFVADGENNRVLIYDIRRVVLQNGPAAIGVLGQADFEGTAPGSGAAGLHDPGHMAYDPANARLFVIDAGNKRVLVFDAHAERIGNGANAIAVLGQDDFNARAPAGPSIFAPTPGGPPPITGDRFITPNGIAHDPVRQLLYVADGGGTYNIPADRILVFDVEPGRLANGAAALAALGAPSAEAPSPTSWGGAEPIPGQFRVRDTRGIALDHENGRLFATGSFESRLVQFNFPRADWNYRIGSGELQSFGTLDAADLGGQSDPQTVSVTRIEPGTGQPPLGVAIYSQTRQTLDARSERHSRHLIAEAAVAPALPTTTASVFVEGGERIGHDLYLFNGQPEDATVSLALRDGSGAVVRQWQHTVPSGTQLSETLTPRPASDGDATLGIESDIPLGIAAFRRTGNSRGEVVLTPAPATHTAAPAESATLPYFVSGAGRESRIVLINPTGTPMEGAIRLFDRTGQRQPLGTPSDVAFYRIPPHSSRTVAGDGSGPAASEGYARIEPRIGGVPHAAALILQSAGGDIVNEDRVTGVRAERVQFGIDLNPTLIRHGDIDTRIVVVNDNADPAIIEMVLDGQAYPGLEVAPGEQRTVSAHEVFGAGARGAVELRSNMAVTVTARQQVTNIRGEVVESELPPLSSGAVFPFVPNGGGLSTEFRLANASGDRAEGRLAFLRPSGEPAEATIIR